MKTFWAKYSERLIHEGGLWLSIGLSFLITDGQEILKSIYDGDYSTEVLKALLMLIAASAIKAVLVIIAPSLFPLYQKNVGILPPKEDV